MFTRLHCQQERHVASVQPPRNHTDPPKANINVNSRLSAFAVKYLTGMPDPPETWYIFVLELIGYANDEKQDPYWWLCNHEKFLCKEFTLTLGLKWFVLMDVQKHSLYYCVNLCSCRLIGDTLARKSTHPFIKVNWRKIYYLQDICWSSRTQNYL